MNTITRKQIAAAVGVSVDTVARRERDWGLDKCRSRAKARPVLYFREKVSRTLLEQSIISRPV